MSADDISYEHAEREKERLLVPVFERLIAGHSALLSRSGRLLTQSERMHALLEGFGEVIARVSSSDQHRADEQRGIYSRLLIGYEAAFESYRRQQESRADDFNLLGVMQLMYKEIRHSMVLAWLIDHDIRRLGTHAQGT